jgi:capsular exopolysaccharide synthesis family protein
MDADLRAARLHLALGAPATPGMAEYLLGEKDEFSVIQSGPMENLFFIPSGRVVPNAAELVANGRMKTLLEAVEPWFDWIIIDSPPAVPVSDASLLANNCDGVLFVVRSSSTPFDVALKMRGQFNQDQLLGVVLNGIGSDELEYQRYYYGHYGNQARTHGKAKPR